MMSKGCFIVFEGIDGAGKTTQVEILKRELEERGKKVYVTAEPTAYPSGKELRRVLSGDVKKSDCEIAAMFTLDRIAHNIEKDDGIERLISEGYVVICDRYYYSTLAYQGSTVDYGWVRALNVDCPEIRTPDLCIFLDLTPKQSMERISKGRESTEIYENEETLTKVRNAFMRVINDLGQSERIRVINAFGGIEEIAANILREVLAVVG